MPRNVGLSTAIAIVHTQYKENV